MAKLVISSVNKAYGGRDLFRDFSLEVSDGMRLGIVGPNGAGKSTLLKLVAGELEPEGGQVVLPRGARLGYVAQDLSEEDLERSLTSFVLDVLPSWHEFWLEWDQAVRGGDEAALARLSVRHAHLEEIYGYNPEQRAETILSGLGFAREALSRPLSSFSGGWRERAKLARVLVAGADILLLDEPTNHLDLEAVRWLEDYLLAFEGVLLFVVHERMFLERVATHILFMGGAKPIFRQGGFSDFLAWQAEIDRDRERRAEKLSTEIAHRMSFVRRFKAKATKARQAQSRMKQVQRMESDLKDLAPQRKAKVLSFKLPEPKQPGKTVLSAVDLDFTFDDGRRLWPSLSFQLYRGQKIALVGANGSGKSTLLKLAVGEHRPRSGSVQYGQNVSVGYYSQHQTEILRLDSSVLGEIRRLCDPRTTEEELKGVLGLFLLGEPYWERQVRDLSGGEKSRLVLASLFLARANFLVLDEPTNHLDLESREALVQALQDFEGTILVVAHDRHLLTEVADELWALGPSGLTTYGGFEEYEQALAEAGPAAPQGEAASRVRSALDKERKRREAEERNALYRTIKPKRAEYERLEAELDSVLAEQGELEGRIADPETYRNGSEAVRLNEAYRELQARSEDLLVRLTALEEEIGALEARRQEIAG